MKDDEPTLRISDLSGFQARIAVLEKQLGERDARIRELEDQLADALRRHVDLAIDRDKEFWRSYADHSTKELLRSNGALTNKLIELGRGSLPCGLCNKPVVFEFTVASPIWNRIVRERGLNEYLCFWCFDKLAKEAGEPRIPVGVNINGQIAFSAWCGNDVPGAYAESDLEQQLKDRDERIRELEQRRLADELTIRYAEQQLKTAQDTNAEQRKMLDEYAEQKANEILGAIDLSGQLKTAQERLAEAEELIKAVDPMLAPSLSWLDRRKEYFSKHSKERGNA